MITQPTGAVQFAIFYDLAASSLVRSARRQLRFVAAGVCAVLLSVSVLGHAQSGGVVPAHFGAVNFGSVNVCPADQTSPKPCHRTSTLDYNVTATTTFGKTKVVTQGMPHLDFTLSTTTCRGPLAAGSSCTVTAKFAARAPGVRMGAVQLTDSSGNLLVSTYVYGNGQGPVAAFNPGTLRTLPVSGLEYGVSALAVDAAGDVYFPVASGIAKFDPRTGVQTTVASGVSFPYALALDGAGNIFVACGTPACGIVEIAAGTGIQTTLPGLCGDTGVALDARGNVYADDSCALYPRLVEVYATTGGQETLLGGDDYGFQGMPLLNNCYGVAVDGADNAYVACLNFGPVYESIAGTPPPQYYGVIASRQFTSVDSFNNPFSVAVDAAGDVYVDDCCIDPSGIYEVAAGTGNETVAVNGPGEVPIAVDGAGNLFFSPAPNTNTLLEMKGSVPATLDFGKIAVGSTSAPQSLTIQNVGNQPLNAVAPGLIVGTNFLQVPGSGSPADCTATFSLAPGASCNLSIAFAPQVAGAIKGVATFTDNALNKTPSASQSVKLRGTGVQ